MKSSNKVLIIPDLYIGQSSGATVTQVLVELFKKMGFQIAVMSSEFGDYYIDQQDVACYPCKGFCGSANIFFNAYLSEFSQILDDFNPTHIFYDGSIINKPLCYLEEGLRRGLHIDVFIFMQDFFCAKLYANDNMKPCTKCLDSLLHGYTCPLIAKDKDYLKLLLKQYERHRLKDLLSKVNHVITSTDEQIEFYTRFGIPKDKCYKMPLPFVMNNFVPEKCKRGDYLVGIAQNRIEKGFQFIPEILKLTEKSKLILAYYDNHAVIKACSSNDVIRIVKEGKLEIVASSWKSGLSELIAGSCGVIIPSIWPTTTEYGLLESMAFSKPVVAFNLGIHNELMKNGQHGYFANVGDLKSFANNMDKLTSCSTAVYENMQQNIEILYHEMTDREGLVNHLKNILV